MQQPPNPYPQYPQQQWQTLSQPLPQQPNYAQPQTYYPPQQPPMPPQQQWNPQQQPFPPQQYQQPPQYQPSRQPQNKNSRKRLWLVLAAIVLVFISGASALFFFLRAHAVQSCAIGVANTSVSIEYQGDAAPQVCLDLLSSPYYSGDLTYYRMTEQPTGVVLCEGDFHYQTPSGPSIHSILRATDSDNPTGRQLCSQR